MADFHWVGSTAANINSLRWGNVLNWRVVQNGMPGSTAPGGTLARLIPATRLPLGNDTVNIGTPTSWSSTYVNPYQPARYNVFSPCLFGGVTTAADKVWEGSTAGTASVNKNGPATIRVPRLTDGLYHPEPNTMTHSTRLPIGLVQPEESRLLNRLRTEFVVEDQ
jgi:hypothetical protein